jgi:hypothetical protein
MSSLSPLGFHVVRKSLDTHTRSEYVILQRPLHRVLAFTRRTIDDVVNCPIVKNEVLGYYKLHKWVERGCEITDMNRWWNGQQ